MIPLEKQDIIKILKRLDVILDWTKDENTSRLLCEFQKTKKLMENSTIPKFELKKSRKVSSLEIKICQDKKCRHNMK